MVEYSGLEYLQWPPFQASRDFENGLEIVLNNHQQGDINDTRKKRRESTRQTTIKTLPVERP